MLAYNSDPSLKAFVLDEIGKHRVADQLVQGYGYWEDGKGCAVGCTLNAVVARSGAKIRHDDHSAYEEHLGIPRVLARLEDRMFERLNKDAAQAWPERFTAAIQPGADLAMVWPRFALWLLSEELPQRTKEGSKQRAALNDVAALYREHVETGTKPDRDRWIKARNAAAYAAAYAAAADDAAAYAADAAADAAYAAYAYAADAAAAYAARQSYWVRASDKLIELLATAPVNGD